jgi:hypothetical protein
LAEICPRSVDRSESGSDGLTERDSLDRLAFVHLDVAVHLDENGTSELAAAGRGSAGAGLEQLLCYAVGPLWRAPDIEILEPSHQPVVMTNVPGVVGTDPAQDVVALDVEAFAVGRDFAYQQIARIFSRACGHCEQRAIPGGVG